MRFLSPNTWHKIIQDMFRREAHDIDLFVKYVVAPGGMVYAAAGREYHWPLL